MLCYEPVDTDAYCRKLHFLTLRHFSCIFHHYFRHGSISGVGESVPIFLLLPNGLNLLYLHLSIISLTFKSRLDHRRYTILTNHFHPPMHVSTLLLLFSLRCLAFGQPTPYTAAAPGSYTTATVKYGRLISIPLS